MGILAARRRRQEAARWGISVRQVPDVAWDGGAGTVEKRHEVDCAHRDMSSGSSSPCCGPACSFGSTGRPEPDRWAGIVPGSRPIGGLDTRPRFPLYASEEASPGSRRECATGKTSITNERPWAPPNCTLPWEKPVKYALSPRQTLDTRPYLVSQKVESSHRLAGERQLDAGRLDILTVGKYGCAS